MKTTCGIFLFNCEGKLLIAHPTNHSMDLWSIPKGIQDKKEDTFTAAIRELYEETNISLSKIGEFTVNYLGEFEYKHKNKKLSAFCIITNFDFVGYDLRCESMVTHMKGKDFPEVDEFRWVSIEEAESLLHESQIPCLAIIDKLKKHVT